MGNMRHRFSLRRVQRWRIWQASRTRWEQSPVVQRYWTRLGRARVVVALALFAVLFSGVFASGAFLVSAFQSASPHVARPHAPARDLRAESKWFQVKHFGNQLPAPDARGSALRQAARLPVSRLGTPRQASGAVAPNLATTPGAWTSLGPQPLNTAQCVANANGCLAYGNVSGRITALAVNPLNGADVWAGAAGGGVWHSTDGGATWTAMTDTQANLSIGSIAIDPANANTIYVGTGEANFNGDSFPGIGILKTTDGGATWTQLGFAQFGGLGIGKIAVDPTNSSILLAAASTETLSTPPGGGSAANNPGIWRSTDSGTTWTQVIPSFPSALGFTEGTDVLFDPAHAGVAYAGISDDGEGIGAGGGVKRSTDHGATWAPAVPNFGAFADGFFRVSLGISADGQHVYAVAADAGAHGVPANFGKLLGNSIVVSTDGGVTWTLKSVPLDMTNDQGPAGTPPGQQWWYELALNVDRSDATGNTAYVGGINLWKTSDGGTTWTDVTNAYNNPADGAFAGVHPDQHAIAFVAGSSSFYLGDDGGVWSNAAGVFANKNASLNITQFYTGSVGNVGAHAQLYGGAQDNGTDQLPGAVPGGPVQWNIAVGGDGGDTVVDFTDNAIAYGEFPGGALFRTTDGGTLFFCADLNHDCLGFPGSVNFVMPVTMAPSDHNTLVVGTNSVFRTTNATTAITWTQISPPFTAACIAGSCSDTIASLAIAPSNSGVIYAGTDAGQIFVTTNGGTTWPGGPITASTQGMVTGIAVAPNNPAVAYASFANFAPGAGRHLFKTVNAGATWTDISASLPNIPFESVAVDPSNPNLVIAGSDAGVFVSQDAGATWAVLATGLPNAPINQVFFNHTGTELYVATHGRGMWVVTFPHIQLSAQAIALTGVPGASPAPQTLTLTNTGLGSLNWSQTTTLPSWLSLDASSGSIASGANQTLHLTFTIPPTDPAQTYTTTLVFSDPHADNAPVSVPVTLVTANVSTTWYFAEGTTNAGFNEFLTLANPGASAANVQVKYLLGAGAPVIKSYLVAQNSRATVNVNTELGAGQNVAMVVTSDQPIIAERPMFFTFRGTIPSGTDVLGATSLASSFDFGYLDTTVGPAPASHSTWLVLLNQNAFAVDEHIAYFPATGGPAITQTHTIPANSRGTIEVARDVPAGRYSALVTLTQSGTTTAADGLVERVLYQVDSVTGLTGAAAIVGVPAPRSSFFFAEGFTTPGPNPRFSERYILSNPCPTSDCVGAATAHATLTFQRTDGTTVSTPVVLAPGQQQIVDAASVLGAGAAVSNSASVTSDQPILAERFMSFRFAPAALGGQAAVGASEAIGAAAPHNLFYFAEGTTNPGFAEFLTIQNPDPTQAATVTVTLLPTTGAPVVRVLSVAPHSRFTLDVNSVLSGQSLSLVVESNVPIVAERPLYFDFRGSLPGGTDVVGYQP